MLVCPLGEAKQDTPYDVSQLAGRQSVVQYLSYVVDGSTTAVLADVLSMDQAAWTLNNGSTQNFGQLSVPIWFKLRLAVPDQRPDLLYLELNYPHHDYLDFYLQYESGALEQFHTGDHRLFSSRATQYPSFVIPIVQSRGSVDIYFSIRTEGLLQVPLFLLTAEALDQQSTSFVFLSGVYFGAILIMLVYNAFIYFTIRDRAYVNYLVFLVASALLQLTITGLAFKYFWPDQPAFNNHAVIISATFLNVSAISFMARFVGIDRAVSSSDYLWLHLLMVVFLLLLVSSFLISYSAALRLIYLGTELSVITGFYVGVKYWLKGVKAARFFAFAWFSYLIFVALYLLDSNQLIASSVLSQNAFSIGSLVELSLLSIAFADKLNGEKELRIRTQQELLGVQIRMNSELDSLVKNRTIELEEANLKLRELSVTDGLTQLKNRYYFDLALKREFKRAAREGWPFSVMMIDIDRFKTLNDAHGHRFGDFCLTKSAQLIQAIIRRPSDTVARYGGEEIAVLLPNTQLDNAMNLAEKVREQFHETEFSQGDICQAITVSIGVASCRPAPYTESSEVELLELADQCLYKAKQNGRDQVLGQKLIY